MTMKRVSEEVKMKELKQQGISILNAEIVNTVIGKPYLIDLFYAMRLKYIYPSTGQGPQGLI